MLQKILSAHLVFALTILALVHEGVTVPQSATCLTSDDCECQPPLIGNTASSSELKPDSQAPPAKPAASSQQVHRRIVEHADGFVSGELGGPLTAGKLIGWRGIHSSLEFTGFYTGY
ncbi:hypothetical protein FB45DRAFT_1006901 [Roridomyces roridus]|uniref:Uncharacterized protein n=1 Tax=Roridomyces roridus TaxID=1738132 RepID=A0AAD7BGL4_9AGAR|nr:hypothetical protein FB45DRAFT_1006901 [Roridomyces roridus]